MQPPPTTRKLMLRVPAVPSVFVVAQMQVAARVEGALAWLSARSEAGEGERTDRQAAVR